jgi:diguanylate cyclase (GGDEF)-like protein
MLDLPTLIWAMLVSSLVLSASVLLIGWRTQSDDGLRVWGWGMFVLGLSYPAYGLRLAGWAHTSILVSSFLTSATIALHIVAVDQFQRGRAPAPPRALVWPPVVVCVAMAALLLEHGQARVLGNTLLLALQSGVLAWCAWAPRLTGPREHARSLLAIGCSLLFAILGLRGILVVRHTDWSLPWAVPDSIQAFTYLVNLAVILLNTTGYVLMRLERAVYLQHELAVHDPLTGVLSRLALVEEIHRAVSLGRREAEPVSLLMIDIDLFKRVNDTYGHQAGDDVLREVSARIQARLRKHDVLGRYGGEEFMIVLHRTPREAAARVAEAVRQAVAHAPVRAGSRDIEVTISVGASTSEGGPGDFDVARLIAASDAALYRAKDKGRNRVETAEE